MKFQALGHSKMRKGVFVLTEPLRVNGPITLDGVAEALEQALKNKTATFEPWVYDETQVIGEVKEET